MPKRFTQRILRLLGRDDYPGYQAKALARALNVVPEEKEIFLEALVLLQGQGAIEVKGRGVIRLPEMPERVEGTYQASRSGYGFVRPDKAFVQGDLYIPLGETRDAMTGDRVVAQVMRRRGRGEGARVSGRVIEILNRDQSQIVGTAVRDGRQWFVQPDGKKATELISIDDPSAKNVREGDKIVVEVLQYATQEYYAGGVVLERLGKEGSDETERKGIIRRFKLEEKFSRRALQKTREAVHRFESAEYVELKGREDIRDHTIITIDPADARDFDDAISLKRLPHHHWQLGVHIADVGYFVREGSRLDQEARQRGTSVYLPGFVVPMLPELLSNGVCSLQEGKDRLVKSAYIKLDEKGRVLGTRFANSLIRSTRRLTYEEVDGILEEQTHGFDRSVVQLIRKMETLARLLLKRRQHEGMLSLELPKPELVYNEQRQVVDVRPESTTFSHTLIEMFMLEANEAVARLLDGIQVPFLRRVHAEPDSLTAGEMARVIRLCGYVIPQDINRKGLQALLASVRGKPESFLINLAVLKSMQKAEYHPAPIGHYAIASKHYCHFTSPIRRYPDLTVHRLLQSRLEGHLSKKTLRDFPSFEEMENLGAHCSGRERNAEAAENELRTLKILQLLSNYVGEEMDGVVTSITNFGVFVQLEKYMIEGLMEVEDIIRLMKTRKRGGRKGGKGRRGRQFARGKFRDICPYKLGEEIRVRIANVNALAQSLDLVPSS